MTLILLDKAVALFSSKTWWPGSARARVAREKLTDPSMHLYYHDAPSVGSPLSKSSYRLTSHAASCISAKALVAARRLAPAAGRCRSAWRCAVTSRCFSLSLNFTPVWWFDPPSSTLPNGRVLNECLAVAAEAARGGLRPQVLTFLLSALLAVAAEPGHLGPQVVAF